MLESKERAVLWGWSEGFIAWGLQLARRDWPLGAVHLPSAPESLASVLLLGCPAYLEFSDWLQAGPLRMVEYPPAPRLEPSWPPLAEWIASLDPSAKARLLLIHCGVEDEEARAWRRQASAEPGGELLNFWSVEGLDTKSGRDILQVERLAALTGHEPAPRADYPLANLSLKRHGPSSPLLEALALSLEGTPGKSCG